MVVTREDRFVRRRRVSKLAGGAVMTQNDIGNGHNESLRLHQLYMSGRKLKRDKLIKLQKKFEATPEDLDNRVQLLGYYQNFHRQRILPVDQHWKEKVLAWQIQNDPGVTDALAHYLSLSSIEMEPKMFARLRALWLEQVEINCGNAQVSGNAAAFIAWRDFETASQLFLDAAEADPERGWLQLWVIHCNSELFYSPPRYRAKILKQLVAIGERSLKLEVGGAPFITAEYVCGAALELGDFDAVRRCTEIMRTWAQAPFDPAADALLALIAIRENKVAEAVTIMLALEPISPPHPFVTQLFQELFECGERGSIQQVIETFGQRIKPAGRKRWLKQIARDELPDFHCCEFLEDEESDG